MDSNLKIEKLECINSTMNNYSLLKIDDNTIIDIFNQMQDEENKERKEIFRNFINKKCKKYGKKYENKKS